MADLKEATYAVAGGYDIHLKEAGSGPAVVFIHGSGPGASGSSNFRRNIDAFVDAGFRVILPDLIGYGASSKPEGIDYTLELFTDTLYDALRQHGIEVRYEEVRDGHNWENWRDRLQSALTWLFPGPLWMIYE